MFNCQKDLSNLDLKLVISVLNMHKDFRSMLENAIGSSEHVIAIMTDIRGFSNFCQRIDSFDIANYLKRLYMKLIDNYFVDASFYKPTGDGLLVILSCPKASLKEIVSTQIQKCLSLLSEFESLCKNDPIINFETPNKIGIGISRGSACRICSNSKTLDYSGRVINLASRLMDLARPSGIIFDASLGFDLLQNKIQDNFLTENVYVRGIAERKPITVYYTKQYTIIPPFSKKPLLEPRWETLKQMWLFKDLRMLTAGKLAFELSAVPLDPEQISLEIRYNVQKGHIKTLFTLNIKDTGILFEKIANKSYVYIIREILMEHLVEDNLTDDDTIEFTITYPVE